MSTGRLKGKRAIVTGGANGIGRAIAEAFAREGADLFFTARSDVEAADAARIVFQGYGVRADYMLLDVGEPDSVARLIERSETVLGLADILVNNVATGKRGEFLATHVDDYDRTMAVNLRFPFFATQAYARRMHAASIPGSIINIGSISATKAISAVASYQCSKAGLVMLSRSAAYELAPFQIRVNTISPGLTATKSNANQWRDQPEVWRERGKDIPMGRTGVPADIAGAAVFLASQESSWMTGAELVVDGGEAVI